MSYQTDITVLIGHTETLHQMSCGPEYSHLSEVFDSVRNKTDYLIHRLRGGD